MPDRVVDRAYCANCQKVGDIAIFRGIAGIVMARCVECSRAWPWSRRRRA